MSNPTAPKTGVSSAFVVMVTFVCGLFAGGLAVGVLLGNDQRPPEVPEEAMAKLALPAPQPASAPDSMPTVHPNPGVGSPKHPIFDCHAYEPMPEARGELSEDFKTVEELQGVAQEINGTQVQVRARVMKVYPNIMGLNWVHLCDAYKGGVLLASSKQWVHPGFVVRVTGRLAVKEKIGKAYTFPLLIQEAEFVEEDMGTVPDDFATDL